MKTEFELDTLNSTFGRIEARIIRGGAPYVKILAVNDNNKTQVNAAIKDKDLERFAVNILKALKSKRLK